MDEKMYDIVFLGHYTKDKIIREGKTIHVDGGAINYGAYLAANSGLKTAVITRLSEKDKHVVTELEEIGVDVYVSYSPQSTELVLKYPDNDIDQRVIYMSSSAGPFTVAEVKDINSKIFAIGSSVRGEVPLEVLKEIRKKGSLISLDIQGYIRVLENGILHNREWPDMEEYLKFVDILKTDMVEAESLTGEKNIKNALRVLEEYGPREVIITYCDGVFVYDGKKYYERYFYPQKMLSRSGRGDTVIAAYLIKRIEKVPEKALIWAAAVASLKLEVVGPFKGSYQDIERLIQDKYE